jgi:N-acetylglucosamine kinase-like BadF-type ATPase
MSDGRSPRGPLYELVRRHFSLRDDLDLCASIYGQGVSQRSEFAQLSRLIADAARTDDPAARGLFARAAAELADMVDAVRDELRVPAEVELVVSCSGGLFELRDLLLAQFESTIGGRDRRYRFLQARLPPDAGAAVLAAKRAGMPLEVASLGALEGAMQRPGSLRA